MNDWHDSLPASIQALLEVREDELGDYSAAVRQQTVLSRLAYKRAVEAASSEHLTAAEVVEMDGEPPMPRAILSSRDVDNRFEVAIRANKALVDMKTTRLDAQERFEEKAKDKKQPKPLNLNFVRGETSPTLLIQRLLILGRKDDAKQTAKDHNLEWSQFETEVVEYD